MKNIKNFEDFSYEKHGWSTKNEGKISKGISFLQQIHSFPLILATKLVEITSKIFSKKEKVKTDYKLEEIEMLIKTSPSPSNQFLKDFDTSKTHNVFVTGATSMNVERKRESPPMPMNSHTKNLLKNSIVISLPFTIDRSDLEFIAFSRRDHQPIYRYIGSDFRKFDLPYTEMIGLGEIPAPPAQTPRTIEKKLTPPKSQTQTGWIQDYSNHHKLNE